MTRQKRRTVSSLPARVYFFFRAALRKSTALAHICFEGFWLGVGSRRFFHEVDRLCYNAWPLYRDESYNQGGLMAWEARAVEKYFKAGQRLLLAGAGGGRETLALVGMGFQVLGFECHEGLRSLANRLLAKQGVAAKVLHSDRDRCPKVSGAFDGLIIGWGAYMLIQGKRRRVSFLRQLRKRAAPGAPLLLSFFFRQGDTRRFRWSVGIANFIRKISFRKPIELGDGLAPNFVHYFSHAEIEEELRLAGFRLERLETLEYAHAIAFATDPPTT